MSRSLFRLCISFLSLLVVEAASANSVRQHELRELVGESPIIFVGTVTSVYRADFEKSGAHEVAVLHVDLLYKGPKAIRSVKLVTKGFAPELYMTCCTVGRRYIFFVRDGYRALVVNGQEIETRLVGVGEYVSPTNGRFSSYPLEHGLVMGWEGRSAATTGVGLDQVVRQIRAQIEDQ